MKPLLNSHGRESPGYNYSKNQKSNTKQILCNIAFFPCTLQILPMILEELQTFVVHVADPEHSKKKNNRLILSMLAIFNIHEKDVHFHAKNRPATQKVTCFRGNILFQKLSCHLAWSLQLPKNSILLSKRLETTVLIVGLSPCQFLHNGTTTYNHSGSPYFTRSPIFAFATAGAPQF